MRGFAHVEFASPDSAQNALSKAGEKLGGRPIRVDLSGNGGRRGGGGGGGGRRGGRGGGRGGDRGYGGGRGGDRGGRGNFGRGGNSDFRKEKAGAFSFSGNTNKVHEL